MAAVVNELSSESKYFYLDIKTMTVLYNDVNQDYKFKSSMRNLKFMVITQALEYSLIGPNASVVSGKILAGENLEFLGIDVARIAIRSVVAGAAARIWAWK